MQPKTWAYGLWCPVTSLAELTFTHNCVEDQRLLTEAIQVQAVYTDPSTSNTKLLLLHLEGYPHKIMLPALWVYLIYIKIAFVNDVCERLEGNVK